MRDLRFTNWLTEIDRLSGSIAANWFEEVRRHRGTDASHIYGRPMAILTAWAELRGAPKGGVTITREFQARTSEELGMFPEEPDEDSHGVLQRILCSDSASGLSAHFAVIEPSQNYSVTLSSGVSRRRRRGGRQPPAPAGIIPSVRRRASRARPETQRSCCH